MVEKFLLAIREQRPAEARKILKDHPDLTSMNLLVAAAAGDVTQVREFVSGRAAPIADRDTLSLALAYACGSLFHTSSVQAAADSVAVVRLLLDHGADPNHPFSFAEAGDEVKLPVLWCATETENLGAIALLLERGAKPDDGESTYHSAQHNRVAVLQLLLAHGADLSRRQEPYGNTPLYFLVGHHDDEGGSAAWAKGCAWLLAHGADPNVGSYKHDEVPLHRTAGSPKLLATTRLLLDYGADPNRARADGRTPFAVAVRAGNIAAEALMRDRGADVSRLSVMDEMLGACFRGDLPAARMLALKIPNWRQMIAPDDLDAVERAVMHDREDTVRALASLGFPATGKSATTGHTALHPAAWFGRPHLVRALLELGASVDVNVRDSEHGSSPMGWAGHGSQFCRAADEDYLAVVELLADAGADPDAATNRLGEPPSSLASKAVAASLKARGF